MKKGIKIVALLLVACMSFMLAGCDLFTTNTYAYLNQVVITATFNDGTKIEINRRDYQTAYNNYGAELINSNGYTAEEAKTATVNALVNRKVILGEAKETTSVVEEVEKNKKELYYQTYQALISNANDYEGAIREDWNMEQADTMAEETSSGTVYTPFKKQAEVVYVANPNYTIGSNEDKGSFKIKKIETNSTPVRDKTFNSLQEVKATFYAETRDNSTDTFAAEEYRRYLGSLKATQSALKTNYSNDELILNEIQRIYDNLEENEYISVYQEQQQYNEGYSTITVQQVLNKYASMMSQSKFTYSNNEETYKTDMLENFSKVNYVVNDEYFHVAHILIKFSDEQQADFDELEALSNNGQGGLISAEGYKLQKEALYNSIKGSVRDSETGELITEDSILAGDVLKEIEIALASCTTNEQKDEAFRNLMYKYNEDDGIMNADYSYIIGVNDSKMVENFTNASRELNENGTYGAVSGLVQSEYGVHIIYYMGKCTNLFEFNSDNSISLSDYYTIEESGITTETSDIFKLTETKLNNLNNKTVFDLVYESLVEDNYSQFENINIETIKSTKGMTLEVADNI